MNVESIVVGVEASRWEGYNERLAISSINIFRRFATEGVPRRTSVLATESNARAKIHLRRDSAEDHEKRSRASSKEYLTRRFFCAPRRASFEAATRRTRIRRRSNYCEALATLGVDRKFRRTTSMIKITIHDYTLFFPSRNPLIILLFNI